MRIALIASPFISVPPKKYGGTELFIAQLAEGLTRLGATVVVYGNGESTVRTERRWLYPQDDWPIQGEIYSSLKDLNHASWAIRDCWREASIIHLNNAPGLVFSRMSGPRWVYTLHHPHLPELTEFYREFPDVEYVAISNFQKRGESMSRLRTIHHGIDLAPYRLSTSKSDYLCFLGRIAPCKGVHNAIQIARRAGLPLKIAGEVQPVFREYFDARVRPHLDGHNVEYLGPADLAMKNELLGGARAMLFPIEWNEPFGLVLVESMACGTPVVAYPGGSVEEIVGEGVSGYLCHSVEEAVSRVALASALAPASIRAYAEKHFSVERMVADYLALYRELSDELSLVETGGEESQAAA